MGVFRMPSLGADMEAGTLVEWLKREGEELHRGDIIAVVETQKGAIEVEVFEAGPLTRLLVQPGAKVPVGTPLAVIGAEKSIPAPAMAPPPEPQLPIEPVPSAFRPAANPLHRASPAARQLAGERGIDLTAIQGSGQGGAITLADVEHATATPATSPMRAAIAAAMARSKREIPHYYLTHTLDVSAAIAFVDAYNREKPPEERLLLGAPLVKAVALAVRTFRDLNGFLDAAGRRESESIHVGVAVSMRGGGLIAPAIHDTDKLPLAELMARMRDLVVRVRRGSFRSSEVSDPTITVSSLGERGVEALLPVIYPPQVAIVGFGAPQIRPWVHQGMIEPRHVLTASLAADHRVSDGHQGALFLRRVADLLEKPEQL